MPENNSCQPAMPYFQFRQASLHDFPAVWEVVNKAREKMLASGRTQWSATYPSEEIIRKDIENETGYVLCSDDTIAAFGVVAFNGEPVYENIKGKWQSDYPYVVIHRLAVQPSLQGHGLSRLFLENVIEMCQAEGIKSIKVDTANENTEMIGLLSAMGFSFCGTVYYEGHGKRVAFEKVLVAPLLDIE